MHCVIVGLFFVYPAGAPSLENLLFSMIFSFIFFFYNFSRQKEAIEKNLLCVREKVARPEDNRYN